jgi:hypothetical protein
MIEMRKRKMKRILSLALVAMMLVTVTTPIAQADSGVTLILTPNKPTVRPDEEFTVALSLQNASQTSLVMAIDDVTFTIENTPDVGDGVTWRPAGNSFTSTASLSAPVGVPFDPAYTYFTLDTMDGQNEGLLVTFLLRVHRDATPGRVHFSVRAENVDYVDGELQSSDVMTYQDTFVDIIAGVEATLKINGPGAIGAWMAVGTAADLTANDSAGLNADQYRAIPAANRVPYETKHDPIPHGEVVHIFAGHYFGILFSGVTIICDEEDEVLYRSAGLRNGHYRFTEAPVNSAPLPLNILWRRTAGANNPNGGGNIGNPANGTGGIAFATFVMPDDITSSSVTVIAHWTPNFGDSNGDGVIAGLDSTILRQHLSPVHTPISPLVMPNADVDGNGSIAGLDSTALRQHLSPVHTPIVAFGSGWQGWLGYHNPHNSHFAPAPVAP